jgi:hypothetical protein
MKAHKHKALTREQVAQTVIMLKHLPEHKETKLAELIDPAIEFLLMIDFVLARMANGETKK